MGTQDVSQRFDAEARRAFMKALLADVQALEKLLEAGRIESGVRRIGAEQEFFLVDRSWRAAPVGPETLATIDDAHFTTELGRFNLECNLDPLDAGPDCLRRMEGQIHELIAKARAAAEQHGAHVVLTGILPTLRKADLGLDNMTPNPRYYALNEALTSLRGGDYQFRIKGGDELLIRHDSVMLEACNAGFQVHFQVGPEEFARLYNAAQAVAAPALAAAVNSPLLFGRRLWRETRIALFEQSVDTRGSSVEFREISPRVSFGSSWVKNSALEVFQEDIARFRVVLGSEVEEDSLAAVAAGQAPRLKALQLHNSTVYRWMRPCYGVADGVAHLRIENRVFPSGPTVLDEMANAALWFGLVAGVAEEHGDVAEAMDFDDAKANFIAAARFGLDANLVWVTGDAGPVRELLRSRLLPLARQGLAQVGVDSADIDRYIGVVEERVARGTTGASWMLSSLAGMKQRGTLGERLNALVAALVERQERDVPAHEWAPAQLEDAGGWKPNYTRVEQYMTTDLFTVREDEIVEFVARIMDWRKIRHVPVEDAEHRLVGLVSHRMLLRMLSNGVLAEGGSTPVSEVMRRDPITISPQTTTLEAIGLMRREGIGCLPVVTEENRLVGIVTEGDFMGIAGRLLEEKLRD